MSFGRFVAPSTRILVSFPVVSPSHMLFTQISHCSLPSRASVPHKLCFPIHSTQSAKTRKTREEDKHHSGYFMIRARTFPHEAVNLVNEDDRRLKLLGETKERSDQFVGISKPFRYENRDGDIDKGRS